MSADKRKTLKDRLPEFEPKANAWDKMMEQKSLDAQVRALVNELPIHLPKDELWANIQGDLNRKKPALIWYGGIAASIILLLGVTVLFLLSSRSSTLEKNQISTLEKQSNEEYIPSSPLKSTEREGGLEMEVASGTIDNTNNSITPLENLALSEKDAKKDHLNLSFQKPVVPFPKKTIVWDDQDILQERKLMTSSKREVRIQWDIPMRRVRLDGFMVRLTEEEWQSLQESNQSKKGLLKLPELVARTPEK
ncbi:MAG: hypothetical protein ACXIUD_12000 [Mongoliitalea sp.]